MEGYRDGRIQGYRDTGDFGEVCFDTFLARTPEFTSRVRVRVRVRKL